MGDDAVARAGARRERLSERRKAVGLTQEQLAVRLNVERTTVARWERGETQPQPWFRRKLATALRVSPEWIEAVLAGSESARPGLPAAAGQGGRVSPYQGLNAFRERDSAFFFGREAAAGQLLDRMARCLGGAGLLVVSGASGVGKSSLLQAGVLPRLRTAGLPGTPGAASWPCLVLTPGRAPLDELAVRAAAVAGTDAAGVRKGLDADPSGFALIARQACLSGGRLLLLVDQFEQLFTQCPAEGQRRALISALHAAATDGEGAARRPAALVVLVIRADFEARCADYAQLSDAVQDRYLVTPMTARQLRMAITMPARTAGSAIDDDLVTVLLEELTTRRPPGSRPTGPVSGAGVLPLLSHALDQAWRNRTSDALTLADYERVGGIEDAVSGSAQRAYDLLTAAQREAARQVFTRLTATTGDGTDTAARVPRAELSEGSSPAGSRDVDAVLEAFAAERLLTLTADSVQISHEVLLSAWPLLRDTWLADTHADQITRTRLHAAAAEWARHSRDASYLYHGSLLDAASGTADRIAAAAARYPPLSKNERDFLRASDRARRRTTRMRQLVMAVLVVLLAGLASTATVALHASQVAAGQRDAAIAGQLIAQSQNLGDSDPVLARLESAAAWQLDPSAQARDAMLNAAALPGIAVLNGHAGDVYCVAFSPDGKMLAVGSGNAAASGQGAVELWDVAARRLIGVIQAGGDGGGVSALAFSPDGKTVAIGTWDGMVSLWDVATQRQDGAPLISGEPVTGWPGTAAGDEIKSLAFSRDGKTIAAARSDGTVQRWDVVTGRQVGMLRTEAGYSMTFSPDGEMLAVGGTGGVWLWNVATGRQVAAPVTGAGAATIFSVAFSRDGKTLGIGSMGVTATVRLWDTATGRETGSFPAGESLTSIAFSPDGRTLVTGSYDGTVRLFDAATGSQLGSPFTGASGEASSLAFAPDGTMLATGSYDGTARLWNVATTVSAIVGTAPAIPAGKSGKTTYTALSPDGEILAVGTSNGVVRLFAVDKFQQLGPPLTAGTDWVTAIAFSHDGRTLATATLSGSVKLWNLGTHSAVAAMVVGGGDEYPVSLAFSPDDKVLAAAGASSGLTGTTALFDVATGRQIGPTLGGGSPYAATAFSPDGDVLAIGGTDGVVTLTDLAAGQQTRNAFSVAPASAVSLAFSRDGQTVAVGASDGTVRLFDVATGRQIGNPLALGVPLARDAFSGGRTYFWLGFSLDGKTLAAATPDGTIVRWNVAYAADPVAYVCAAAGRPLTRAEWTQHAQGLPYRDVCA